MWEYLNDVPYRIDSERQQVLVLFQNRLRRVNPGSKSYDLFLDHSANLNRDSARKVFQISPPLNAQLQITKGCNFACEFCYASAIKGKHIDTLDLETWNMIISKLYDAGVANIQYVGGEAFFRQDFPKMFAHAQSLGLSQTVITNSIIAGAQFPKFKEMLRNFAKIQVSMNGIETNYEKSVGARTWDKFLEAVRKIVEVNENVWLSYVVTPENIDEIPMAVTYASQLKVKGIRFGIIAPLGRAGVQDFNYFKILPDAEEKISAARISSGGELEFEIHFNPELGNTDQLEPDSELRNRGEGQNVVFINHEGDIFPFPLLELEELKVGNILEDDFAEIWQGSPILKNLRNFDHLAVECKTCLTPCGLSSRSMTYLWTGSIESKLPCHRWGYLK